MLYRRLACLGAFVLATAAAAPDMLPLRHGIFVPTDVACRGASNAAMVNYWGGRSAIGSGGATCTIQRVTHIGTAYTFTDTCRDVASGESIEGGRTVLTIASPTAFRMNGTDYRYCGPRPVW